MMKLHLGLQCENSISIGRITPSRRRSTGITCQARQDLNGKTVAVSKALIRVTDFAGSGQSIHALKMTIEHVLGFQSHLVYH